MLPRHIRCHRARCDRLGNNPPLLLIAPPSAADNARYFRVAPNNLRVVTNVDHNVHTILDPKNRDRAPLAVTQLCGVKAPLTIDGRCPPEDCGGPWGYAELLDAIKDPKHERHAELTERIGEGFNPEADDAESLTAEVAALAKSWARKPTKKRARPR